MWFGKYNVLLLLFFVVNYCLADAGGEQETVPEVIVTADPLGGLGDLPVQPVQVIGKEELKRKNNRSIGEAVANEVGVSSGDFGAGVGRPIIRGLAGSRVLVLENGIRTMDAADISVDHAVPVESLFANQIEIFRGPATLLFGSGASGGIVNVVNDRILKSLPEQIQSEVSLQYETVSDGVTGGGGINAAAGPIALHVDGLVRDTGDYDIPGFAELGPDEPERGTLENSFVETENLAGGLSYISNRGFIGFSVSRLWNEYGVPGAHHGEEEGEEEEEEEEGASIDMDQSRYDVEAVLETPFAFVQKIRTRWGWNDYRHNEIEGGGEIGTTVDNEEMEGRFEIVHERLGIWNGAVGIQYRDKEFAAVGEESFVPPSRLDSFGIFLLEKADIDNGHLNLGVRYETQDAETDTGLDSGHDLYSISAGVDWDVRPDYHIGVSFTHAQRAPSIEELYADGPHIATNTFEMGDPELVKEKANNIDVYLRKSAGRFTFSANVFYNRIDNFIFQEEQDLNGDGLADRVEEDFTGDPAEVLDPAEDEEPLLVFQTQEDADFFGFELEGEYRIFDDHRGELGLRLWADYVEAERNNDVNLPRITPWRFGAGVAWRRDVWNVDLSYTHVNEQDNTAPLETETGSYELLSLYVGYRFAVGNREINLFASGSNLFDEEIRRHTSFVKDIAPLPGRSGTLGIRVLY